MGTRIPSLESLIISEIKVLPPFEAPLVKWKLSAFAFSPSL